MFNFFEPLPKKRTPSRPPLPTSTKRTRKDAKPPSAVLEHVLGLTTTKNSNFAVHPSQDIVAYAAGCAVVLYNYRKNKQLHFLQVDPDAVSIAQESSTSESTGGQAQSKMALMNSPKAISCLTFSPDGSHLAVGETGFQPRVLVWDWRNDTLISELKGHKYGILNLAFSPNGKILVSVGFQHDGFLNAWNWKSGAKIASNKVSSKVHALSFASDSSYCVTAGLRHIKYWYFEDKPNSGKNSQLKIMTGRPGILGDLSNNTFVDAVTRKSADGVNYTYFVTTSGLLCQFGEKRVVEKWIDLQVGKAYSININDKYIVCGCENGVVRLFEPESLNYAGTLPKPHPLGVNINTQEFIQEPNSTDVFPDAVAVRITHDGDKVAVVYSDRSIYIWDIKSLDKIGKYRSSLYHSGCVWGVELFPSLGDSAVMEESSIDIPLNSFVTYSADGTIRFWNLDGQSSQATSTPNRASSPNSAKGPAKRNPYSRELLEIIYTSTDKGLLKKNGSSANDGSAAQAQNRKPGGIRTLSISPDGKYIASGDREGNLRLHDLSTMEQIGFQEAHNGDILSIDFSKPYDQDSFLVATAGRDRLIHVFDINESLKLIQTLDDHSAAITSTKFAMGGQVLISSATDQSIIFRKASEHFDTPYFVSYKKHCAKASIYDMDIDPTENYITPITQDKRFHVFEVESGKQEISHRPKSLDENGSDTNFIRVAMDPSGSYVAISCSDKCIRVYDIRSAEMITKLSGHSEQITSLKFSHDCSKLITTSGDGCIFVWKLAPSWTRQMVLNKHKLIYAPKTISWTSSAPQDDQDIEEHIAFHPTGELPPEPGFSSTENDLPLWAVGGSSLPTVKRSELINPAVLKGQWAQRAAGGGIVLFSEDSPNRPFARMGIPDVRYTPEPESYMDYDDEDGAQIRSMLNGSSPSVVKTQTLKDQDESSDDEPLDSVIYVDRKSIDPTTPAATFKVKVQDPKELVKSQSNSEEEAVPEEHASGSEEDEIFKTPAAHLYNYFDIDESPEGSPSDGPREDLRKSISAKFLSASTLPDGSDDVDTPGKKELVHKFTAVSLDTDKKPSGHETPNQSPAVFRRKRANSVDSPFSPKSLPTSVNNRRRNTPRVATSARRPLGVMGVLSARRMGNPSESEAFSPFRSRLGIESVDRMDLDSPAVRFADSPSIIRRSLIKEMAVPDESLSSQIPMSSKERTLRNILALQHSLEKEIETHERLLRSELDKPDRDGLVVAIEKGFTSLQTRLSDLVHEEVGSESEAEVDEASNVSSPGLPTPSESLQDSPVISMAEGTEPTKVEFTHLLLQKYSDLLLSMVDSKISRSRVRRRVSSSADKSPKKQKVALDDSEAVPETC
ncbi:WD40 repeat-like protein [Basidiobolus meristosporus CBS 931.73]|uniref:WD40 repeat-like protein n=1 Tax=Basidiobolus meristosporus CBS 931.73 TaxID=1314790 RepID=A0A1Y1ZCU1_9FUNG|nr:WD40 repeat-like protein [Basidiobolus meristosporus CBS 931.73]|eukprot:ORY08103.1 WD40 repeat-like protein [Basidiobolus meristosporus CBS 931.73]